MAGKKRKRAWVPLDVGYLTQDTIVALRDEFGPAGPLGFLALILEAHNQGRAGGEPGMVNMRYVALANLVRCAVDEARGVVRKAEDVGLLALTVLDEGERFEARLLKRDAWEAKDPAGAARNARYRAAQRH